jgi:hypothetical protein
MPARSVPGALVHAALLSGLIDLMDSGSFEEDEMKRDLRKAQRLVESIAAVLREHSCGVDPLSPVYMSNKI